MIIPSGLERYQDNLNIREYFQSDRPKLLVIDESHNLRNAKSNRYKFLVDTLLRPNNNLKVLMLSATPINNTLLDIRNQFKLMVKDDPRGFKDALGISNIDYTFRTAQRAFHEWRTQEERTISGFIKRLPANFFKLTDSLTVARTRSMAAGETDHLVFPAKEKPVNLFVTPKQIGHFDTFEELFDHFPPMLSGYQPAFYVEQTGEVDILQDERLRDRFLVKMLYILLVKRLESSWCSFMPTVEIYVDTSVFGGVFDEEFMNPSNTLFQLRQLLLPVVTLLSVGISSILCISKKLPCIIPSIRLTGIENSLFTARWR